jgi:hypothetical protein
MAQKIVFSIATVLVFFVLDQYWLFPFLFGNLPNPFGLVVAAVVALVELSTLFAEWVYF